MRLVVATQNPHKFREIRTVFHRLNPRRVRAIQLVSLSQFSGIRAVRETGRTFKENAIKKAVQYARQTGCLTLADDSGICADYLGGNPGVRSARFAGRAKDDLDNCLLLLKRLRGVPAEKRGGEFCCSMAIASPRGLLGVVTAKVRGSITAQLVGRGGFGYDPLFYFPRYRATFGQISADFKDKVSHRGKALNLAYLLILKHLTYSN